MPDISMCQNMTCPKKENCYRFTAAPGRYQSYTSFTPDEKGECSYYMPNRDIQPNGASQGTAHSSNKAD